MEGLEMKKTIGVSFARYSILVVVQRILLISVLLSINYPVSIFAACPAPQGNVYNAVNASQAEVQSCIDAAESANGGTVNIPRGAATWTSYITKTFTKDIVIQGAGSGIDGTVITGGGFSNILANGTTSLTIKDMRFIMSASAYTGGIVSVRGSSLNKVLKNLYIDMSLMTTGRGILCGSPNDAMQGGGVISGCTIYNPKGVGQGITIHGNAAGTTYYWTGNPQFGTANATFIEDNIFNFGGVGDGAFDAYSGARVVFRYNTVKGTGIGWHGNDSSSSPHSFEIYNNTFQSTPKKINIITNARGGTALIYNNTADSTYAAGITLANYRSCQAIGRDGKMCQGGGYYDRNSDPTGYHCYQQPGTTGADGLTQWPMIAWNNKQGTTNNIVFALNGNFLNPLCGQTFDMSDHVKEGREYINYNTCDGNPSDFCSTWWDDVNKKGKLKGSDYIPYPYPHPLVSASPTTSVPPTIAVSPTIKDFGTLPINTSSPAQRFTVTTTGGNLNVDAISVTGTDATQFAIQNDSCTGKIIAPETGSCTFDVKFAPSSVGAKAANVAIVDNDSNTSKLIAVNGTGTSQIPAISFSPTSLSFSNVLSGTLSSPQTINVSNNSANFATISSVSLSGTDANQFSIPAATDYCTGETVAASGNCSFQIIFSPTSGGEKTANVNLTALYYSNPATLPLYGSAVVYQSPVPRIKISKKK